MAPRDRRWVLAGVLVLGGLLACADRSGLAGLADDDGGTSGAETGEGGELDLGSEVACASGGDASVAVALLSAEPLGSALDLDLACTFLGISKLGDGDRYGLSECQSLLGEPVPAALELILAHSPATAPILDPGTVVRLRYLRAASGEAFALWAQPGGLLLLAAQVGDPRELLAGEGEIVAIHPDPIALELETRACGPALVGCEQRSDAGLRVDYAGEDLTLIAGEAATVGAAVEYQVALAHAREWTPADGCAGPPRRELSYSIALLPEG